MPVYTQNGKNILSVAALKEFVTVGFFKGVLLTDSQNTLQQQGNIQSGRIMKFKSTADVRSLTAVLKSYINEAVAIEAAGKKVVLKRNPEPIPEELIQAFDQDPAFERAFYALTPGRQRGYIIHFSQPKQAQTRIARIEKYKQQIVDGLGLHDRRN